MTRIVSEYFTIRGGLDDGYTLYETGKVLREYDRHTYSGGQNLQSEVEPYNLREEVKQGLLSKASEDDKALVKKLLNLDE